MPDWSPQRYKYEGEKLGVPSSIIENATKVIIRLREVDPRLPVVLTLYHLSILTDTPLSYLRNLVERRDCPYKEVYFRKHVPGRRRFRVINIPETSLLRIQTWIAQNILRHTQQGASSFAYHPLSRPVYAAKAHCGCKWLIKVDIEEFFQNVSEGRVYRIFRDLGYPSLLSFELARLTTVTDYKRNRVHLDELKWTAILSYVSEFEGFLPQGAPTSPMLSNLAMIGLDLRLKALSDLNWFVYTRYSDDLSFSTKLNKTDAIIRQFKRDVVAELLRDGFNYNKQKTVIRGPGSRKIVLGMIVDGPNPRLPNEDKDLLRQHLYFLTNSNHGPAKHAVARKTSISGIYHHVRGKIAWAEQIEPVFGKYCLDKFNSVKWPPIRPSAHHRRQIQQARQI
jgi:RNA-directed DNA polymerase